MCERERERGRDNVGEKRNWFTCFFTFNSRFLRKKASEPSRKFSFFIFLFFLHGTIYYFMKVPFTSGNRKAIPSHRYLKCFLAVHISIFVLIFFSSHHFFFVSSFFFSSHHFCFVITITTKFNFTFSRVHPPKKVTLKVMEC